MGFDANRRSFLIKSGVLLSGSLLGFKAWSGAADAEEERVLLGLEKPKDLSSGDFLLRKEAADSFASMRAEAKKSGISIYSQSSYRSFQRQLTIWENKHKKYVAAGLKGEAVLRKIITYSTIPGTSRHHWGTDLDIIDAAVAMPSDPLNERHFLSRGVYNKLYEWMLKNAQTYGFYLSYTHDEQRIGFEFEPWHWSYKPLSQPMLHEFLKIDLPTFYSSINISGKADLNSDFLAKYKKQHILGINPVLLG